ncbi:hypothetical protein OKJ48_20675 [Streptomyces kunmingensis]|uniref:PPE family domain-containing protein n=1 Tax=Streptomyces kunmingensis TaxID=68225 RepID=A0ABU6CD56_9ACTN|nr:hypothetical protein [Streptomyces kunmingensis]MEB3962648.1 hypothetical protein [Streptomyces kunmingensis]
MSDLGSQVWGMAKSYRFAVHSPEELWTMVEPADGGTAADLGALLTSAAKTIKEIGGDLKTHSTSVEWEGEGADAFHKWIDHAARATLRLGDYSESAGKWLGHAADTLHEVKPQLETLKNSSAAARSILDAHAAVSTDVGNHDGGPSASSVKTAKSQYDNDRAEASQLMTKLAQSYAASTDQIEALKAPEFPDLPTKFVPRQRDDLTHRPSQPADDSSNTVAAAAIGGVGVAAAGAAVVGEAARGASLAAGGHHPAAAAPQPRTVPDLPVGGPNIALDRAGSLPSPTAPTISPPASPPSALPGGTSGISGTPTPALGGTGRYGAPLRAVSGGRVPAAYGPRGPMGTPTAPGTPGPPGASRVVPPGREVPGMGPATPGGTASPVRGPGGAGQGRASDGIAGGRPTPPQTGRPTGAVPRGTVVGGPPSQGGTPSRQTPGTARGGAIEGVRTGASPGRGVASGAGRGSSVSGARMPAHSDGVVGGQPQPSKTRRGVSATPRTAGDVRGAESRTAAQARRGGEPARGASPTARKDDARRAPEERPRDERPEREDTEVEQPAQEMPELRLPGLPPTTRRDN